MKQTDGIFLSSSRAKSPTHFLLKFAPQLSCKIGHHMSSSAAVGQQMDKLELFQ